MGLLNTVQQVTLILLGLGLVWISPDDLAPSNLSPLLCSFTGAKEEAKKKFIEQVGPCVRKANALHLWCTSGAPKQNPEIEDSAEVPRRGCHPKAKLH